MNSDSYKPNQDRVSIVQGGYVSSSGSNQLSVSKKANILNKASASRGGGSNALAPGGGNHSSANNNEANDAGAPGAIFTVSIRVNYPMFWTRFHALLSTIAGEGSS